MLYILLEVLLEGTLQILPVCIPPDNHGSMRYVETETDCYFVV